MILFKAMVDRARSNLDWVDREANH